MQMRKRLLFSTFALALTHSAFSQSYTIQTIAGGGWDIPGISANLARLSGIAIDGAGNVYMALTSYSVVVRMDPSGQLSLVAGNGSQGSGGDHGPATLSQLNSPNAVAVDVAGAIYIADSGNNLVRMVSNGIISTVAGGGTAYPGDNGPATSARLGLNAGYGPGLAVDSAGSIYFADSRGIREVTNGVITTVAGGGFDFGDNVAATSAFVNAAGVAVDAAGRIYFADRCSNRIRKVSNGVMTTVAGNGKANVLSCAPPVAGSDGNAASVSLNGPQGVAVDTAGNVYFTEGAISGSNAPSRVRKVSNGNITTVAGGSPAGPFGAAVSDNIPATSAVLAFADGIAVDPAGNLYISDNYWPAKMLTPGSASYSAAIELGRLRKVSNGVITTLAGASGDNGPALGAQLNLPAGVAVDSAGNLYIADSGNNIIREASNGAITTIAGTRAAVVGCDCVSGPALSANLFAPQGIALDSGGNLYISNAGNILEVSHGLITPVADMVTRAAGVALDAAGNLYFADWTGNRIGKVSNGAITTIAGDGTSGFGGDSGPAAGARLANPSGLALDGAGNVYFADTGNQRVRRISNGVITTVAGNGTAGFSGDNGPAASAQLNLTPLLIPTPCCSPFFPDPSELPKIPQLPTGIAVDASGNLYIVDAGNQRVRKVSNGVITTIAGNGTPGYSGDGGPAAGAQLNNPSGIAVDAAGKVYVSDSSNGRIRVLISPDCAYAVSPASIQSPFPGGSFPIAIQTGASCPWLITGFLAWITLPAPPPVRGPATVSLVIAANTGPARIAKLVVAGQPITVTQAASPGFGPAISLVANAFGESPTIAPNTWVEIKGSNLAPVGDERTWQDSDFVGNRMPTALDGVSVTLNGKSAYLYYISAGQINILTPPDLTLGPVQVNVSVEGVTSAAFTAQAQQYAPSLFVFNGGPYVTAVHASSSLIGPPGLYPGLTTPAKPGEAIVLYANGFGPIFPPVVSGSASQMGNLPTLPIVKIGDVAAMVQFAGLVSPGLYQFNVVVPASAPDGDNVIGATYNGAATQPGTLLAIQH